MPISSSWPIASALWALGLVALLAIGACSMASMASMASATDYTKAGSVSGLPVQTAVSASAKPPYCDYPNNYYPALCGIPKQKATDYCAEQAANDNNPHWSGLRARYVDASHQFSFAFTENPMGGCGKYAGSRQVSYYEEMRSGLTGVFARVGPSTTVTANEYDRVGRAIPVTFQCSAPLTGSAVREVVKVSWTPKSGWGTTPTNYSAPLSALPLIWSYATKAQIVC
jgi:hypothetical protein